MTRGKRLVASSTVRPGGWRRRLPTAFVSLGSVVAVGAALVAAVSPMPGLDFLPSGHWVYNVVTQLAVHIDGGSPSVDASVGDIKAGAGSQVVQGPGTGYVVDEGNITVFGQSDLSVEKQIAPPSTERPVTVEAAGGPYLFYRGAGKVVRLGDQPPTTIDTGGTFISPVVTADGTVWVYKKDSGAICPIARAAVVVGSCPAQVGRGHTGALTLVRDRPEFVDTTADALYPVTDKGLGDGLGLGRTVSADARVASSDVDGRVVIVDPDTRTLHLLNADDPGRDPKQAPLPNGKFEAPSSTGSAVAVVDKQSHNVLVYDGQGKRTGEHGLPKNGDPRVSKGEDNRIYVESGQGTDVVVVDRDGTVTDVPVAVAPAPDPNAEKAKPNGDPIPGRSPLPERDERTTPPTTTPPPPTGNSGTQDKPERADPPVVAASPPGAPKNVRATAGNASATVTWGAAASNKAAITQYRVSWTGGSSSSKTVPGTARSAKITGLTNGASYTFSVYAVNSKGRGPAATSNTVTLAVAASAPTGLTLMVVNGTDMTFSWKQPNLAGGTLQSYQVTATGYPDKTVTGRSASFSGVVPGQAYTLTVRAVTKTPDGRTLTGAVGTRNYTVPGPKPTLTVTRGDENCPGFDDEHPECAQMHVVLTGFEPHTDYDIYPHSDDPEYGNPGSTQTTDANGSVSFDAFEYFGVGHDVWVTVDTPNGQVRSPNFHWE